MAKNITEQVNFDNNFLTSYNMRLCSIIMRFKELLHEKMHIGTNYHNKKGFLFKMLASKY